MLQHTEQHDPLDWLHIPTTMVPNMLHKMAGSTLVPLLSTCIFPQKPWKSRGPGETSLQVYVHMEGGCEQPVIAL